MSQTISLCMITKNEEKWLKQCLDSVKDIVDEIIIVDTGSTDKTKDIAQKFCDMRVSGGMRKLAFARLATRTRSQLTAKIYDFNWIDDFSAARNESLRHATKEWILVMDADEIIEEKDLGELKNAIENSGNCAGFALEQRSYINNFFEGAIKNKSDFELVRKYPFYISHFLVRLFRNNLGIHFKHRVHELVEDSIDEMSLKYRKLDVVLHHFGSLKEQNLISAKTEQYSKIILKQLEENPDSARYNYQAARMYLGRNDFSIALKHFEKVAKIDANYKLVFSEIAKIYLQMNDKNRAIEYFKKSVKHNPENPSPANNLAVVYMSIGKFNEAKKILEEQLKKHPNNEALKYNYEKVLENLE